jgi:hypothetical protein
MAQWVEFTADYNHVWPSRAVTAYKAGMTVFVKKEVAEAAIGLGRAKPVEKPSDSNTVEVYVEDDAAPPEASDRPGPDGVAQSHDAEDVGAVVRGAGDEPASER